MRFPAPLALFGLLALPLTLAADEFGRTLTAEEKTAAGLDRLTPAELEKLEALVERYRSAASQAAGRAPNAPAAAPESGSPAAKTAGLPVKQPSWLAGLIAVRRAEERPDEQEAVVSRIAGKFSQVSGKHRFVLENGQVWQLLNTQDYFGTPRESPVVTIRPGSLGSFWLEIEGVNMRFRVKPVKLE